jgi:hypothetical protein
MAKRRIGVGHGLCDAKPRSPRQLTRDRKLNFLGKARILALFGSLYRIPKGGTLQTPCGSTGGRSNFRMDHITPPTKLAQALFRRIGQSLTRTIGSSGNRAAVIAPADVFDMQMI